MRKIIAFLMIVACLAFPMTVNDLAVYAQQQLTGQQLLQGAGPTALLNTANTWILAQTFNAGIVLPNNAYVSAQNTVGTGGNILGVDTSNNWYVGDIGNVFGGSGFIYFAGNPYITLTTNLATVGVPLAVPSVSVNGSQAVTGVQGSSATKFLLASGTFTLGHCLAVGTDLSAVDSGVLGCGTSGTGPVTSIIAGTNVTVSSATGNVTINAAGPVPDIVVTIPALTLASNTCSPAYPSFSHAVMTGLTNTMAVGPHYATDPGGTAGWNAAGQYQVQSWPDPTTTAQVDYRTCNNNSFQIVGSSINIRFLAQ